MFFYERYGLCDEDNDGLDDTRWVRGQKYKKRFHRHQWNEGEEAAHRPESIWD